MKNLILASESRYKQQLLARLRLPFVSLSPSVDETPLPGESAQNLAQRLAKSKAEAGAYTQSGANSIIISSDQTAVIETVLLDKPGNHEQASKQLKRISGRQVSFLTGLCVIDTASNQIWLDCIPFQVCMRRLSDEQIERYLLQEKPYDCVGSFKSEAYGITLFESMQGDDPTALIGLPLIRLIEFLNRAGISLP